MRRTPRGLPIRRPAGLLKVWGAIASAVVALLLVAAPASQAGTPAPTPPPSNQQFTDTISGFLRDDSRRPIEGVKITAKGFRKGRGLSWRAILALGAEEGPGEPGAGPTNGTR